MMKEDLIAGKGNRLIMLLHGAPGTGKALTAGNSFPTSSPANKELTTYARKVRVLRARSYPNECSEVTQSSV